MYYMDTYLKCHIPPPKQLPDPGIEPKSPVSYALQVNSQITPMTQRF